ncbi:hypothetical protein ABW55_00820 [Acinetobacter sp. C15]|nr:hypothetical protein ABW55_00820 [Acinetobacter sp. C15]KQC95590.1 hypothetical protein APD01_13810 [Acinetobacter soli]
MLQIYYLEKLWTNNEDYKNDSYLLSQATLNLMINMSLAENLCIAEIAMKTDFFRITTRL